MLTTKNTVGSNKESDIENLKKDSNTEFTTLSDDTAAEENKIFILPQYNIHKL